MTSCNKADSRLSPNSLPSKRKAKNRIYKTYYHDIYVTYNKLTSSEDLNSEDSDPDETQLMLSSLVLNTDSAASTTSEQHTDCRGAPTKQSIGGLSTVDSGVVSHDSLLDRYREMSAPRSECSESPSSKYSTLDTTQRGRGLGMAEFDPLNPPVLLDSKLRSQSRTRLEEHQTRGKSPCRSHGVKQIINFFEGSQEDLASRTQQRITGSTGHLTRTPSGAQSTSGSTDNLHHGNSTYSTKQYSSKPPPIKQPLYTSPIRLARKSRAKSKPDPDPVNQGLSGNEDVSGTTITKVQQDGALPITYVTTEPPPEEMTSSTCPESKENSSNHKVNGATTNTEIAGVSNGDTLHEGHNSDAPLALSATHNINSNNRISFAAEDDRDVVCNESVSIELVDSGSPQRSDGSPLLNGHDSKLSLDLDETPAPMDTVDKSICLASDMEQLKLQHNTSKTNSLNGTVQDSPSKKNGEWFLKVTDNAQEKLLELCEVASHHLEDEGIPDEASGQIRAAIGKAQLLVNKKFKQFRGLCEKNLTQGPDEPFPTTSQDLAGFWDLVYIQVEQCENNFRDIQLLKSSGWVPSGNAQSSDVAVVTPRKPVTPRGNKSFEGALKSEPRVKNKSTTKATSATKARDEARKRLMAAKKAMKERRNSETDDVIYVSSS